MSPRLIVNTLVVLAAVAIGAVVNAVPNVPQPVAITGTVLAAIVAPLGARGAIEQTFALLPQAWRQEIVLLFTVGAVGATTLQAAVAKPPAALTAGLAVLIALSTAIGQRSQATPIVNPHDALGRTLTPVADTAAGPSSSVGSFASGGPVPS